MRSLAISQWLRFRKKRLLTAIHEFKWFLSHLKIKTQQAVRLSASILITCLHLCASGYSQEKINLSEKNALLQTVLQDIQKQTSYILWYEKSQLPTSPLVTIDLKDVTLKEALTLCSRDFNLDYSIAGNMVVIKTKAENKDDPPEKFILKGLVINEKGESLEGAAVLIKGTHKGTQTDVKGNFILKSEKSVLELEISYTGYTTKSVIIQEGEFLSIQLSVSVNPLDQIQVIAYGTTSKRLNTGSVSSVNAETIAQQPVSNPLAALEGRVSGLVITEQTGVPGGNYSVEIRGKNSIFNGNNPYYIIDGVPFTSTSINSNLIGAGINGGGNPLNNINTSDIESIEVLKDADATAIYGSRGANGVILITTKKGKPGKTNFDLNVNYGGGKVTRLMPLMNTSQYIEMRKEAFENDGAIPDPSYDYDLTQWDTTRYTNWQKTLIGGQSDIVNVQGTISGGNANTQFIAGGSYYGTTTVFPGDFSDQKVSTHLGITQKSTDRKFQLNITGNFIIDQNTLPQINPARSSFTLPPNVPNPYSSPGVLNWEGGTYGDNPYQFLLRPYHSNSTNLIGNATMSYEIVAGLTSRINMGYNNMQVKETSEIPSIAVNPAYGITTGSANFGDHSINSWIVEPQLQYLRQFSFGKVDLLAGLTFQQSLNQGSNLSATGYTNDALLGTLAGASNIRTQNTTYDLYRYDAFFMRINYDFKEKYIINLTGRRDGSSRFGPGRQFADFGAIGAAWIFSKEKGLTELAPVLSFGKFRASWGLTGNDQIGDYQYLETWANVFNPYQGIAGLRPTGLANPNYSWETNRKTELALELGFWKDRFLLSGAYFSNHSSNQLILYSLPGTTGFSYVTQNSNAEVRNSGFELEMSSVNLKSKDFTWQTAINFTVPKNILLNYPNLAGSPFANIYVIGQPLTVVNAYHYLGVSPPTGLYIFEAKDPNNPIYPDDLHALKNTSPVFYGGFQNTFSYKNWKLDFLFQFVSQQGRNYLYYNQIEPGMYGNQPSIVFNRWQKPGQTMSVEKYSQNYGDAYNAFYNLTSSSDGVITDASFIRLKNISFSYQVSGTLLSKLKMRSARIYVQGQNLITITHFMGMDPENQNVSALPPLKVLTAGIQCSF